MDIEFWSENLLENIHSERLGRRWEDNIKINFRDTGMRAGGGWNKALGLKYRIYSLKEFKLIGKGTKNDSSLPNSKATVLKSILTVKKTIINLKKTCICIILRLKANSDFPFKTLMTLKYIHYTEQKQLVSQCIITISSPYSYICFPLDLPITVPDTDSR
jgi:hypothetical protein